MRTFFIAGNWKMNTLPGEAAQLVDAIVSSKSVQEAPSSVIVAMFPPHLSLTSAIETAGKFRVSIGGQNCHHKEHGAYTGEISASVLAHIGCSHVIVGHSERRRDHGETNELIGQKATRAITSGLIPIICVGETLAEHEAGRTKEVVGAQLSEILNAAGKEIVAGSIIAYEPVWAIGTGRAATPQQAQDVHQFIRHWLDEHQTPNLPILYGGSVTPENASALFACEDIDGALVGGASLKHESFCAIIDAAAKASTQ